MDRCVNMTQSDEGEFQVADITKRRWWTKKYILLAVCVVAWTAIMFVINVHDYMTLSALQDNRELLDQYVQNNYVAMFLLSCVVYFLIVAASIPGTFVLTVTCGYLFGQYQGAAVALTFGTLGSYVPFMVSRYFFYDDVHRIFNWWVSLLDRELKNNPYSYLLAIRLFPMMPLMLSNVTLGVLKVRSSAYLSSTFIGLAIPTFSWTLVGKGLHDVVNDNGESSFTNFLSLEIIGAMTVLSLLALFPLLLRLSKRERGIVSRSDH